jgi:superoxide dismutase, Cu-Zn family
MKINIKLLSFYIFLYSLLAIHGAHAFQAQKNKHQLVDRIRKAICIISPTQGNNVAGIVAFTKTDSGIFVVADLSGLSQGKHGFHIHEYGDCNSADGSSAGSHFNPEWKSHGAPSDMIRHIGDLGNIEADGSGNAHLQFIDRMLSFEGDYSIIGRSVIVHKSEDDLKTQPTGNAGSRVACGVIGISE